jgi:hypothetical protein
MSTGNLSAGTKESKPYQILKVNGIESNYTTSTSTNTNEITAIAPETEIISNSDMLIDGDLTVTGTITGGGSPTNPFNQPLNTYDPVKFASVSSDEPNLLLEKNPIASNQLMVSDIPGSVPATAVNLQIESNGDSTIWVRSDADGTGGGDNSFILCSQKGGEEATQISMLSDGITYIINGDTVNAISGQIVIATARAVNNGTQRPSFSGVARLWLFANTGNVSYRDLNMLNNDIFNIADINTGTLSATTLPINNADDTMLVVNPSGVIGYSDDVVIFRRNLNVHTFTTYSTASTTYVNSGNAVAVSNLDTGTYRVEWSCQLSNSNSTVDYTTAKMVILQTALPDVILSEITTPVTHTDGVYTCMSGYYIFENANFVDTEFRILFKTSASTALLKNYTVSITSQ